MKKINVILPLLLVSKLCFSADPLFNIQWGLNNTGQSSYISTGELTRDEQKGTPGIDINWIGTSPKYKELKKEVVVAVLDSGLDVNHPELKDRIWYNKSCDGKTDLQKQRLACNGWNFLDNNNNLTDDIGHGTHVAGIIAANNDKAGIVGVTGKNVKIMPVKVMNATVDGFVYKKRIVTDIIADGIQFAVNNGADVINMSIGWPDIVHRTNIKKAIKYALSKNVPIIAASGNNNKQLPVFPCSETGVICVGAIDNNGAISEFSNFGGKVDILAPGRSILGLYPLTQESRVLRIKGYESKNGSSQAAPFISGVVASMKLYNEDLSINQIKARLYSSSKELNEDVYKYSKFGLVDMKRSIEENVDHFVTPEYKSLKLVTVAGDKFSFMLPIENLGNFDEVANVEVRLVDEDEVIYEKVFSEAQLRRNIVTNLPISGTIKSFDQESELRLEVIISGEEVLSESFYSLSFARDLTKTADLVTTATTKDLSYATITSRSRKLNLRPLLGIDQVDTVDEYYIQKGNEVEIFDAISGDVKRIPLPGTYRLVSIFKADINLDGSADYFAYSVSEDKKSLYFDYFDNSGQKLFGELSRFTFPITKFEGLPIKNSKEDFEYIVVNNPNLGRIRVPLMMKNWILPTKDNSDDLFDKLKNTQKVRPYYLNPVVKGSSVELEVRTLESYDFIEKVKQKLGGNFKTEVSLSALYDHRSAEKNKITLLLSHGREFIKNYYKVTFNSTNNFRLEQIRDIDIYLDKNKLITLKGEEDVFAHTSLLQQNQVRVALDNQSSVSEVVWSTSSWRDPIFDILGGFNFNNQNHLFIESRYWINYLRIDNGEIIESKLPINRDSSFPGVGFSETMKLIDGSYNGQKAAGLLVDANLIYGNRVYTIITDERGLRRPLRLSFKNPSTCINLGLKQINGATKNAFVCITRDKSLEFKYFDLLD